MSSTHLKERKWNCEKYAAERGGKWREIAKPRQRLGQISVSGNSGKWHRWCLIADPEISVPLLKV